MAAVANFLNSFYPLLVLYIIGNRRTGSATYCRTPWNNTLRANQNNCSRLNQTASKMRLIPMAISTSACEPPRPGTRLSGEAEIHGPA